MYDSRRLRGWNHFTGGSIVTFASILFGLRAKREGGDYVSAPSNKFMLCMILAGCAGGTVLPTALSSRLRRFCSAFERNGILENMFWRLSTKLCCV